MFKNIGEEKFDVIPVKYYREAITIGAEALMSKNFKSIAKKYDCPLWLIERFVKFYLVFKNNSVKRFGRL